MFEFIMFVIFVILFAITIAIDADFINITNNIIIIIVNSACIILGIYMRYVMIFGCSNKTN